MRLGGQFCFHLNVHAAVKNQWTDVNSVTVAAFPFREFENLSRLGVVAF